MRKKLEKIIISIIILQVMLLSDFIFVGKSIVMAIVEDDIPSTTTNCKNIELSTYFKLEDESHVVEKEMSLGQTEQLYIQVEVKKEGYFNRFSITRKR